MDGAPSSVVLGAEYILHPLSGTATTGSLTCWQPYLLPNPCLVDDGAADDSCSDPFQLVASGRGDLASFAQPPVVRYPLPESVAVIEVALRGYPPAV